MSLKKKKKGKKKTCLAFKAVLINKKLKKKVNKKLKTIYILHFKTA